MHRGGKASDAAPGCTRRVAVAFDLHANVWVSAHDRAGLERLARYVLRPPFAQERLRLRSDGRGSWRSNRWSSWSGWRQ